MKIHASVIALLLMAPLCASAADAKRAQMEPTRSEQSLVARLQEYLLGRTMQPRLKPQQQTAQSTKRIALNGIDPSVLHRVHELGIPLEAR